MCQNGKQLEDAYDSSRWVKALFLEKCWQIQTWTEGGRSFFSGNNSRWLKASPMQTAKGLLRPPNIQILLHPFCQLQTKILHQWSNFVCRASVNFRDAHLADCESTQGPLTSLSLGKPSLKKNFDFMKNFHKRGGGVCPFSYSYLEIFKLKWPISSKIVKPTIFHRSSHIRVVFLMF